jgi:hypothetical protein
MGKFSKPKNIDEFINSASSIVRLNNNEPLPQNKSKILPSSELSLLNKDSKKKTERLTVRVNKYYHQAIKYLAEHEEEISMNEFITKTLKETVDKKMKKIKNI